MSPEPRIRGYLRWLRAQRGLAFTVDDEAGYERLWRWSTTDLDAFWHSIWDFFDLRSPTPVGTVLADAKMPGARWFPGVQVNYAQQVMRHADAAHAAGHPAIVHADEAMLARGALGEVSWPALRRQVASLAARLRAMGVAPGDRVVAVLPNVPETVVAFLACASVGTALSWPRRPPPPTARCGTAYGSDLSPRNGKPWPTARASKPGSACRRSWSDANQKPSRP